MAERYIGRHRAIPRVEVIDLENKSGTRAEQIVTDIGGPLIVLGEGIKRYAGRFAEGIKTTLYKGKHRK